MNSSELSKILFFDSRFGSFLGPSGGPKIASGGVWRARLVAQGDSAIPSAWPRFAAHRVGQGGSLGGLEIASFGALGKRVFVKKCIF